MSEEGDQVFFVFNCLISLSIDFLLNSNNLSKNQGAFKKFQTAGSSIADQKLLSHIFRYYHRNEYFALE
jgi:hypothetical protein